MTDPEERRVRRTGRLVMLGGALLLAPRSAEAFPPYRSTDAGTAGPWELEVRLGMVKWQLEEGQSEILTPLLRLNLGLPGHVEVLGEAEFVPAEGRLGDAALGLKWVPVQGEVNAGAEVLALLPVRGGGGAGLEATLAVTWRKERTRLHLNGSGVYDARDGGSGWGWKGGTLLEVSLDGARPGLEVHARDLGPGPVVLQAGPGAIIELGPVDLRLGVHAGLTRPAPDVMASAWLSGAFALKGE